MQDRIRGVRLAAFVLATVGPAIGTLPGEAHAQRQVGGTQISVECGGIGEDEAARMRAAAGSHSLLIQFVSSDGSYLADVHARIDDPLRDLRAEADCGPIGLVDVPSAGRYRVTATYDGHAQEQWVNLKPAGGARMVFRWRE